jgi:hypothetical protein
LLTRDGARYLDAVAARQPKPPPASPRGRATTATPKKVTLVRSFALGLGATWRTAIVRGSELLAQGVRDEEVIIARATLDGQIEHVGMKGRLSAYVPYRLESAPGALLLFPLREVPRLTPRGLQGLGASDAFPARRQIIFHEVGRAGLVFDAFVDDGGLLWVVHSTEGSPNLVLSTYDQSKWLGWSKELDLPLPDDETTVAVAARGMHGLVTYGSTVHIVPFQMTVPSPAIDLGRPAVSVAVSPPHTRRRLAVAFEQGCALCWPTEQRVERFASDLVDPATCLTRDGLLVAAGRQRCAVYRTDGSGEPILVGTAEGRAEAPVVAAPGPVESSFVLVYADGLVQMMSCP